MQARRVAVMIPKGSPLESSAPNHASPNGVTMVRKTKAFESHQATLISSGTAHGQSQAAASRSPAGQEALQKKG